MPINKTLITLSLLCSVLLSSVLCIAKNKGKYKRPMPRPVIAYKHKSLEAPPGMVYIRGGVTKIKYDQSSTDTNSIKKVSLTSFFIDKTEVTNEQYREFENWVADSIAIVKYLKDDKYFIDESKDKKGKGKKEQKPEEVPSQNNVTTVADSGAALNDSARLAAVAPTPTTTVTPTPGDTSASATPAVDTSAPITNKRINWAVVNHNKIFNSKDADMKAKLAPMLDENGNIKKEIVVFKYTFLKPANGMAKNSKKSQYKSIPVNVHPNEECWAQDLTNSQTDLYVENYYKAKPYNDYPVVGINWFQANAFSYWRSLVSSGFGSAKLPSYMRYYRLVYTLPSEAQWVYAAEGYYDKIPQPDTVIADTVAALVTRDTTQTPHDSAYIANLVAEQNARRDLDDSLKLAKREAEKNSPAAQKKKERMAAIKGNYYLADYMKIRFQKYGGKFSGNPMFVALDTMGGPYVDSTPIHRDPNGMLQNFKQEEGNYWEDGAALTTPVMAFAPNEFGLYNMEGNVAEWVMDAYSPSVYAYVSDINPVLLYDADSTDADAMKRKVVRGGSFIGNAQALTPYYRDLELQNVSHCFIGFRCVVQAPEILFKNVATRHRTFRGKEVKNSKLHNLRLPEIH